jgi:hypothetical protein
MPRPRFFVNEIKARNLAVRSFFRVRLAAKTCSPMATPKNDGCPTKNRLEFERSTLVHSVHCACERVLVPGVRDMWSVPLAWLAVRRPATFLAAFQLPQAQPLASTFPSRRVVRSETCSLAEPEPTRHSPEHITAVIHVPILSRMCKW